MQMSVIAWVPPPHTVWRHKMMPGYFYMLTMKTKTTWRSFFLAQTLLCYRSKMAAFPQPSFFLKLISPVCPEQRHRLILETRPLSACGQGLGAKDRRPWMAVPFSTVSLHLFLKHRLWLYDVFKPVWTGLVLCVVAGLCHYYQSTSVI